MIHYINTMENVIAHHQHEYSENILVKSYCDATLPKVYGKYKRAVFSVLLVYSEVFEQMAKNCEIFLNG